VTQEKKGNARLLEGDLRYLEGLNVDEGDLRERVLQAEEKDFLGLGELESLEDALFALCKDGPRLFLSCQEDLVGHLIFEVQQ